MRTLEIHVKPNARASRLIEPADAGAPWRAELKAPPVDGKANEELIRVVAEHFDVPRSNVALTPGAGARRKRVRIVER
ncbi:MAG: hypothetical protein K0Q76_1496 [Panacagrimonas sp.]|nr:DUF167 domain-containing protein [Panacagrimonas sp.]MCC2656388.1 hypothetical protein [Panacagrimonas sp.]